MCGGEWNKGRRFIFTLAKAFGLKLVAETPKIRFIVSVSEAQLK
jgi:hypothetical protein